VPAAGSAATARAKRRRRAAASNGCSLGANVAFTAGPDDDAIDGDGSVVVLISAHILNNFSVVGGSFSAAADHMLV
jgi:hypothetical protein